MEGLLVLHLYAHRGLCAELCVHISSLTFGMSSRFNFRHSNRCVVLSHYVVCVCVCLISLMTNAVEHLLLVCHLYIAFGEVFVQIFCPFFYLG